MENYLFLFILFSNVILMRSILNDVLYKGNMLLNGNFNIEKMGKFMYLSYF